jgi:hypothetical protein
MDDQQPTPPALSGDALSGDALSVADEVVEAMKRNFHPAYAFADLLSNGEHTWGSVQYNLAEDVFNALRKLKESGVEDPIEKMTWGGFKAQAFGEPAPLSGPVMEQWIAGLVEEVNGEPMEDKDKDLILGLAGAQTLDPVLVALRSLCWTLWGAAPRVADAVFGGFDARIATRARFVVGRHGDARSLSAGIACFLLCEHGYVADLASFADFDT